jgi:hypothetical protein
LLAGSPVSGGQNCGPTDCPQILGALESIVLCGESHLNGGGTGGTNYLGPTGSYIEDGGDYQLGSVACSDLDDNTEATADGVLLAENDIRIMGGYCGHGGTLAAAETHTITLRSDAADTVPVKTCSFAQAEVECVFTGGPALIAGGSTIALKLVHVGNNVQDDIWCRLTARIEK